MSEGVSTSGIDFLDALPCGVVVTDVQGTILSANRTFCSWVGFDASELVGRKQLQTLFTMGGRIFHQTHWAPALQMQGSLAEVKFDVRCRDGAVLPMMLNAVRTVQDGCHVDIVSLTVAKERNQYERELVAARKRADELVDAQRATQLVLEDRARFAEQMVAIVSHDLRNPLAAILVSAGLLDRHDGMSADRRNRLVSAVGSSARSAQRLIEDLLDFTMARVGRGLSVTRARGDVHALVEETVENLALVFPARTVQHVALGEGDASFDGHRVAQLLGNLVGNAMAYGDPTAVVTVTSEVDAASVRLSVHNHGTPIPAATLATMFDPMVRGDMRGDAGGGSARSVGLGLFIVRAIATAHGGTVDVVSDADHGTTFTFACPRD